MSNKINLVLIDMDGVCTNFIFQCCKLFGKEELYYKYPGGTDLETALRVSSGDFWKKIDSEKEQFWSTMECHPYFNPIMEKLKEKNIKWLFCTKPSKCPYSASGKMMWMHQKFNKNFRNFIITPQKWACANKNTLLIDDHAKNTKSFEDHGGHSLLVPALDNELGYINVQEVIDQLDIIL